MSRPHPNPHSPRGACSSCGRLWKDKHADWCYWADWRSWWWNGVRR
jgi:hypothetical protein